MRQFVTLPNMITSGNLTAGFLALVAMPTNLLQATVLVLLAAGFDSLDGAMARRLPTKTPLRSNVDSATKGLFGANLDSLADLVSFGVVPALALYLAVLHSLPILGLVGCLGFLLCGAWRLARFPLVKNPCRFVGLPIPPAGVVVMVLAAWGPPRLFALLAISTLSVLMISSLPFPTLSGLRDWPSRCLR